ESGVLRGPTMLGAALTNRPFLKQMREATINLSEPDAFAEEEETEIALTDQERAFLSETVRQREENARLRAALARQRAESRLAEAKREGRVTPAMEGWLRELAELDDERFERVVRTLPVQVVFDEMGSAGEGEVSDPCAALDEAVSRRLLALRGEDPSREVSYGEALGVVQREQPELVTAYRRAARSE
ncbi:hypothetical protein FJZ36_16160, partial [Candidatus Poribacteria bacterium]|nr:hypothetical protein [Candidatus Poribacteria bacterium]